MSGFRMMAVGRFVTCFELKIKGFPERHNVWVKRKDKSILPFKKGMDDDTIC